MARVTIILEDTIDPESGQEGVTCHLAAIDPMGRPAGSPRTGAEIAATGLQRMWRARALPPLIMLVCGDMTGLHARMRPGEEASLKAAESRGVKKPAKPGTPDKTGA